MGRELVQRRIEVLRRPVAVVARIDAAAHAAGGHVVHRDVATLDDGLVVALPLVEQRLAPLLLDLVVRDLRGGGRLHGYALSAGSRDTRGRTSRASVSLCSNHYGKPIR